MGKLTELRFCHINDTVDQILFTLNCTFKAYFTLFCDFIFVSGLTFNTYHISLNKRSSLNKQPQVSTLVV